MNDANKWRLLDCTVVAAYATAVLVAVVHHEPWTDEAQAWLIARDMPFWKMMFGEMHYEGSPGLWHAILWVSQHLFHARYAAMNWIGAMFAIAGASVLIFAAPFPRLVRYLMASSYYIVYQYAVVARPYVMLLLFGAFAAMFYRRRNTLGVAVAVALLCGISLHGAILGGAIACGVIWHRFTGRGWVSEPPVRVWLALGIVAFSAIMVVVIAFPASDVAATRNLWSNVPPNATLLLDDVAVEPWPIGALLLLILGSFVFWRKETVVFALGVGGLMFFEVCLYGMPQHRGAVVVALIVSLWIAWPDQSESEAARVTLLVALILGAVFALQTTWAVAAWRNDFDSPYSGAKDAATYLHDVGADKTRIFGFTIPIAAIQAYYDRSIFENWPTSYLHHSKQSEAAVGFLCNADFPNYIVVPVQDGNEAPIASGLMQRGYTLVHVSPGEVFFKQGVWVTETFFIYRRI